MRVPRSLDSDSREHEQEQEQVLLHVLYLIYRRLHVPLANRSFVEAMLHLEKNKIKYRWGVCVCGWVCMLA